MSGMPLAAQTNAPNPILSILPLTKNRRPCEAFRMKGSLLLACLLTATSGAVSFAAETSGANWRNLPLIKDGEVHPDWIFLGYGEMTVDGGALRTDPDPRGLGLLVYAKEKFGNCQIRVVFKTKDERSNAGVYVRIAEGILDQKNKPGAPFERNAQGEPSAESLENVKAAADREEGPWFAVHRGYEVQITDTGDPWHRTGSIYSLAPSSSATEKTPGEWKSMVITLDERKIFVDLDGERITAFDPDSPDLPPRQKWHEPKREPERPIKGYIGLQTHDPGDVVWFKEVSVRPLLEN